MGLRPHRSVVASSIVAASLLFTVVLLVWALSETRIAGQTQTRTVIRAQYVETMLSKDGSRAPVVVEEGTYFIDPAGRYRVERLHGRSRTAEIVDSREKRRTALDLDRKVGVSGSLSDVAPGTASLPTAPIVEEWAGSRQRTRGQTLGTKVIAGGLEVEGIRFVWNTVQGGARVTLTMDTWRHAFSDRSMEPVLLELRFEDAKTITIREVTDVSEQPMDDSLFVAPSDFNVVSKSQLVNR